MKKTYINPETIVVRLMPTTVLAESPAVTISTSGSVDAAEVGTKGVSDVNVWDNEW